MKRILLILSCLFLLLGTGIVLVNAQSAHLTHASVPHLNMRGCSPLVATCPPTPAPGGNNHNPGDPDGDGIPNGIDQCPNDSGPSSNSGCPVGTHLSAANNAQIGLVTPALPALLPVLPTMGNCVLATKTSEGVNVRQQPSTSAAIVGTLDPKVPYLVISILHNSEGIWYKVIPGWVAARVVRTGGGNCDTLPVIEQRDATDNPQTGLAYPEGFTLTLDKGDGSGEDTPQGYCASTYGIDVATAPGADNAIHIEFGDGSVRTCIKLDADGHGFGILPPDPCDVREGDKYCWDLPGHSSVGIDQAGIPTMVSLFQPQNPAGEPPPDTDKVGVLLSWGLIPPGPCKTGDPSCKVQAQTFFVNFVPPGPCKTGDATCHAQGVLVSWGAVPPDPCKQGAQSCPTAEGTQGVLIDFLPAVQDNPAAPNGNVAVDFFPNGFDPNVGGFTQIENQPGGSSPGDPYGFTQIENQPLSEPIAIHFSLPAVR